MEMQLDLFAAPPTMPTKSEPLVLSFILNPKRPYHTHIEVAVRQNDDGTWSEANRYGVGGYCGGSQPFWGDMPSFDDALTRSIARLLQSCRHTAFTDTSSCCGKAQKADALKLVEWLEDLAAEYGITGLPARGAPFTNEMMGYAA